uniref:Kinesin motor domain-containing protein n=1 Tax=Alexandrium monilatum TaxID=311494 RepID=A0A7S4RSJ0_9DINO
MAALRRDGSVPRKEAAATCGEDRDRRRPCLPADQPPASGVKVVCRLRPMNEREKKVGTVPAATASTERREVSVVRMLGGTRKVVSNFHFDGVLTSFSSQSEVYQSTLSPLIGEVLAGYEATAFAYGQTGTGKTYTMEGEVESDEGRGLVPRAAAAVIDALSGGKYTDYSVTVSYLEIYNEELSDLLAPPHMQQQKLDLKDGGGGRGVCCQGLSEVPVSSVNDILELVHRAQERRRVAETRINARSSRSHSIFTMKVRCRRAVSTGELENVGKLHLVDLAGSECAKKATPAVEAGAPAAGARPAGQAGLAEEERERKSINQSLLTLGRVITALRDGSGRVPYRDSKLTRLLQDSLGGKCKTVIIATISPALGAVEETISTLTYAEQASGIQNRPVASSLLRSLRYANGEVKGDGSGTGQGTCDFAELEMKVAYLTQEVEEAQAALARKYREAQEQAERAQCAEERLADVEEQLDTARLSIEEGSFVRAKLASFGDHQSEVASQLATAFRAASAHGEVLAGRLTEEQGEILASRRQARELLAAAEVEGSALARSSGERVADASKALGETHAAHAAATGAARGASQEQQQVLLQLLASVKDSGAKLTKQLGSLSAEARKALEQEQEQFANALDTIESAASSVIAVEGKVKADTAAATARDVEALGKQADALREELGAGREATEAGTAQLVQDISAARQTAKTGNELACKRLRGSIQDPLAGHEASLQESARLAGAHAAAMAALGDASKQDAQQAALRRRALLDALAAASAAHGSSATARPQALGRANEAVREALGSHAKTVDASLTSVSSRLGVTKTDLAEVMRRGQCALSSAMAGADAKLTSAWREEVARLEKLQATLTAAAREQRAGHAAEAVQRAAAEAAQALTASLAAAVEELTVARDNIAGQVAELQQQRAAEQEIVDMLKQQREALQADVASQHSTLESVRRELGAARAEVVSLREGQQERRAKALEAIQAAVSAELGALGEALGAGAGVVEGHLAAAGDLAKSAEEAAAAAEERNSKLGLEVGAAAGEWSQAVGRSCGAVSAAQERARGAAEAVEAASSAASSALVGLGAEGAKWGEACDRVSGLIDDASEQRGGLSSALEALRPEWQASHDHALEGTAAWQEGCSRIDEQLAVVAADVASAARELEGLREGVAVRCGEAEAAAGEWRCDGEAHTTALKEVASLGDGMAVEAAEAEKRRSDETERRGAEAQDLSLRAGQAVSEAGMIVAAAAAHAETVPVDFAAGDMAMASAAATVEVLSNKAAAAFAAGANGIAALRSSQAAAAQGVCEAVTAQADKAANFAKLSATMTENYRKAAAAGLESSRQRWCHGDEAREALLGALGVAAEAAGTSAEKAVAASGERLRVELAAGEGAKDRADKALAALASGTEAGLGRLQSALRSGLSDRPLLAFSDELQAVPAHPEAAAWPQIEALPRPSEEQLAAEFHRAKGRETDFTLAENVGQPKPVPARANSEKKLSAKEAWGASGDAAGPLPRRALAEINS